MGSGSVKRASTTGQGMGLDIRGWWAALSTVAVLNCAVWAIAARSLWRQASPDPLHRKQLWLSAVYVLVCGFRSLLPRADVQRICLLDTPLSSVFVGRTVATVAELCFAVQWALFVRHAGEVQEIGAVRLISRWLVPMIVWAELASWYAVVSTNFLGNVIEQSTWTLTGLLLSYCFFRLYPQACLALRRRIQWTAPVIVTFIYFMCTVDVPHYLARWQADQRAGKSYLGVLEGLRDSAVRWTVTYDWNAWADEVAWMSLYFSIGVWMSIALSNVPLCKTSSALAEARTARSSR